LAATAINAMLNKAPPAGGGGIDQVFAMKTWRRYLPMLILGAFVLLALWLYASRPRLQPVPAKERAWLVSVQRVHLGALAPHATLYGRLESLASAQLRAAVSAEVKSVAVVEGDRVQAGDLLVRLDEDDARLRLEQREADVIDAEARVEAEKTRYQADQIALKRERRLLQLTRDEVGRLRDLVRKKVGARSALDNARQAVERQAVAVAARERAIAEHPARLAQAEAALKRAHALREQARLDLARCTVRAPFPGTVARRSVAPGRRVRVGDPLLTLYDDQSMVLRALLPDRYLGTVREALAGGARLSVHGVLDGRPIEGVMRGLVGEVDPNSGGVPGLFDIRAEPSLLQEGRFVQVDLTLPVRQGVLSLPHEAVYGEDRIYIVDEAHRIHPLRIQRLGQVRGAGGETRLLVSSPRLRDGMRVITTQLPNAVDGLLVRIAGTRDK
jgi:RND family efflux transporter MFP subunit